MVCNDAHWVIHVQICLMQCHIVHNSINQMEKIIDSHNTILFFLSKSIEIKTFNNLNTSRYDKSWLSNKWNISKQKLQSQNYSCSYVYPKILSNRIFIYSCASHGHNLGTTYCTCFEDPEAKNEEKIGKIEAVCMTTICDSKAARRRTQRWRLTSVRWCW